MTSDGGRSHGDPADGSIPTRVIVARRPWAVPAIVVVALGVVLVGLLGQKPVLPRPSAEATSTPTPVPVGLEWTEIPLDPTTFEGALVGLVVSGPQGVLALGQDRADRHPIAWTSPDGRTWARHDQPPEAFGGGSPDAAVAGGPGFIAMGYQGTANGTLRDIWTSPDGVTWTRTPSPTGRGFYGVTALVGSGGTAVLIADVGGRQAVLSSIDGQVWAETPDPDATFGRGAYIYSAIESDAGLLAVGVVGSDESAMWRSSDGRDWSRVKPADPSVFTDAHLSAVFRTHAGFLVTGYGGSQRGESMSWTSDDGVTWARSPDAGGLRFGGSLQAVRALTTGDLGVSGDAGSGGSNANVQVTVDLGSWFDVSPPTLEPLDWTRQATVVDDRIVVLGQEASAGVVGAWVGSLTLDALAEASPSRSEPAPPSPLGSSPSPTAGSPTPSGAPTLTPGLDWHLLESRDVLEDGVIDLSLDGVVRFGSDLLAFGSAGSAAGLWRSVDAVHWERLPVPPMMRGARIAAAATFAGRIVAVGAMAAPDGTVTQAVWTSADGLAWIRGKGAPDWSSAELTDIVAGADGLIAVGGRDAGQGSQAAAWTSSDGSAWTPVSEFPPDSSFGEIRAIARGDLGFVAVGRAQDLESQPVGAAWTSPDGRTWTKIDGTATFAPPVVGGYRGEAGLTDVVAGGPGFVALGSVEGSPDIVGAIFTSPDGRFWTRVPSDPLLDASTLSTATTWSGGLAVGGNLRGYGGPHPMIWTSQDGLAWVPADEADFTGRGMRGSDSLNALIGDGPGLIGVGTTYPFIGRAHAAVWVGAPGGEVVADHVCPTRIDSLARLASMSGADRAACIGDHSVRIVALARAGINDCGDFTGVPDLSGCGAYLELAPIDGGPSMMSLPIDRSLVGAFDSETFAPWTLTLRTDVVGPTCDPAPAPNGLVYEPIDGLHLQCRALLRLVAQEPVRHR